MRNPSKLSHLYQLLVTAIFHSHLTSHAIIAPNSLILFILPQTNRQSPVFPDNNAIMGWTQWALLRFANKTYDDTLKLKFPNTGDHWGWPFEDTQNTSTRNKIEYSDIEKKEIEPQTSYAYGQTGKQNEWAGMEGTVDIYTKETGGTKQQKVARIYYSCPWSGSNKFSISDVASGWKVDQWGADYNGDALGSITIEVRRT